MATKHYLGVALVLVILSSSIYFLMPDKIRIDIENTKTKYSVMEGISFALGAVEYVYLYDGTKKMRASSREIDYWNDSNYAYASRTSEWKDNITTIQTYTLDINNMEVEKFPLKNELECINCQGKIIHYEIREILYDGETKEIESPFSFGHNLKIEWQDGAYYSKVFQQKYVSDKIVIRYNPEFDSETYSVRIFDPEPQLNRSDYVKLIYTHNGFTEPYTIYEVCNPTEIDYEIDSLAKFKPYFVGKTEHLEDWGVKLGVNKSQILPSYTLVCNPYYDEELPNGSMPYNQNCSGYIDSYYVKEHWEYNNFTPIGKTFKAKKCYRIKVWGKMTPSLNRDRAVDNIISYAGMNFTEHDWWNMSCTERIGVSILPSQTDSNMQLQFNLSQTKNLLNAFVIENNTNTELAWLNTTEEYIFTNMSVTAGAQADVEVYICDVPTPQYNVTQVMLDSYRFESQAEIDAFGDIFSDGTWVVNYTSKYEGIASATVDGSATKQEQLAALYFNISFVGTLYMTPSDTEGSKLQDMYVRNNTNFPLLGIMHNTGTSTVNFTTSIKAVDTATTVPLIAGWVEMRFYDNSTHLSSYVNGIPISSIGHTTGVSFSLYRNTFTVKREFDVQYAFRDLGADNPTYTVGDVETLAIFNVSLIQYIEAIYWDSDEVDYALNITIQNLESTATNSLTLRVDPRFNSTTTSVGTIGANYFKTFRFINTTIARDASADKTFNITSANVTDGNDYLYSNTIGMFIPGQIGVAGAVAGDPLCTQYLQVDSFTGLTIEYNLTVECVNPKTDTNYTNVTITPFEDFGALTDIFILTNSTNQTSFYNTSSRGTSDGLLYNLSGAVVSGNISLTTNIIKNFVPIDPPYAFTKDGIVDCDQGMYVNKDITLATPITFRGVGDFLISAVLRVAGIIKSDTDCKVVINDSGRMEVT